MRFNPIVQLSLAKLRDLLREPEALFWVFVFPVLLALALGIAFRSGGAEPVLVGVQEGEGAGWVVKALEGDEVLRGELLTAEEAKQRLRKGDVSLVVIPGDPWTFWFDPTREESRAARLLVNDALQQAAGRVDPRTVVDREMKELGSRYIDFLIPGLLGMNLMGTGMWGIGFYLVSARSKHLLKRLVATPMRRSHFLLSQMTGRLIFLVFEVGVLVGFARLVFGVPIRGSWFALVALSVLGALTFGGVGLLVASRARTIEGVSGLMNFVMLPMWILSGTFFSTARFPDLMQPLIQLLPLTAVNDSIRAVMLDGATLASQWVEIVIAGVWGGASFVLALILFRWT